MSRASISPTRTILGIRLPAPGSGRPSPPAPRPPWRCRSLASDPLPASAECRVALLFDRLARLRHRRRRVRAGGDLELGQAPVLGRRWPSAGWTASGCPAGRTRRSALMIGIGRGLLERLGPRRRPRIDRVHAVHELGGHHLVGRNVEARIGFLALAGLQERPHADERLRRVAGCPPSSGPGRPSGRRRARSASVGDRHGPVMKYGDLPPAKVSRAMS